MQDITIGAHELCAWKVAPGVVWVQTRNAEIAERLKKLKGARLVVRGVQGGYLRTFEFEGRDMTWASKLIARETSPNREFSELDASRRNLDLNRASAQHPKTRAA